MTKPWLNIYTLRKHVFLTRRIDQKVPQMSPCSTWPKCHYGQIDLDLAILIRYFFYDIFGWFF